METLQSELPSISIFNAFLTQVVVCWRFKRECNINYRSYNGGIDSKFCIHIWNVLIWIRYFRFWQIRLVKDGYEVVLYLPMGFYIFVIFWVSRNFYTNLQFPTQIFNSWMHSYSIWVVVVHMCSQLPKYTPRSICQKSAYKINPSPGIETMSTWIQLPSVNVTTFGLLLQIRAIPATYQIVVINTSGIYLLHYLYLT